MPITTPQVPEGLPELMRGLAKSVIKENPENIYVHAAEYFENLIHERDGELDRGYTNFSAYKVYTDYKDKCRVKGGGNDGGSLSAGSVGDIPSSAGGMALRSGTASAGDGDDDSGGSASATRGRRKKRVRRQGSKDSNKSVEKQESAVGSPEVPNGEDEKKSGGSGKGSRQDSLDAIKEDSPDLIEQAMVKVQAHQEYQTPRESRSINKTVSVDSIAAANAVSSVLQDAVVESDEADRETGEAIETQVEADLAVESQRPTNCEDVDSYPPDEDEDVLKPGNAEEYGSTPSTAEVTGEVVGEAEVLVEDAPQATETNQSEENMDAPIESKETSDEVDLPVDDSLEKKEEPITNGSIEAKSESPKQISIDRQDSGEVQAEGVDTVDADKPTLGVEETVPELPDVPSEEPGAEMSVDSENAQAKPIVEEPTEEEPSKNETKEEIIEDANIIDSPKESSVNNAEEPPAGSDEKAGDEPAEENSSTEKPQTETSTDEQEEQPPEDVSPEKTDSVDKVTEQDKSQELSEGSKSNENEGEKDTVSPNDESVEADANVPSNSEDVVLKEESEDKSPGDPTENATSGSLEEELKPKSTEEPATEEVTLVDENNQEQENKSPEGSQSVENPDINEEQASGQVEETEQVSSGSVDKPPVKPESVEEPPSSSPPKDENAGSMEENPKSEATGGEASPVKSASTEDQPAVEENPAGSPEKVGSMEEPPSEGSDSKEAVGSVEGPADDPNSNGSAKASKEPSLDKTESDLNVEISATEGNPGGSPEKVGSTEEPQSEASGPIGSVEEPADEPNSSGSAKPSKEPSLDKTESELNASVDQSNTVSKESSAKESEGDTSAEAASGQERDGSVDAGEMSLSSRMGDDEEDAEPEHPASMEKDDEAVAEPKNNGNDQADNEAVEPSAPPSEETTENDVDAKPSSEAVGAEENAEKSEGGVEPINSEGDTKNTTEQNSVEVDESKEEVVEEPCIQKQVSPSTSMLPIKQPSVELEEIKKVDLASFNKDSAEALFYSLKKTELENQQHPSDAKAQDDPGKNDDDDDADVVVKDEPPPPVSRQPTKRSFTDDFLENSPITEEAAEQAEGDGVANEDNGKDDGNEVFNPMMAARARNTQLLNQLHSRDDIATLESSPRKTLIRRCMTERVDLARQDTNYVDLRKYDPDYVEEEDQFDGYYIGSIKNKILASSVSVADSDYYDPEQVENTIDDNNVQTALETIASTDTESTLPSQTTIQANKGFLKRSSQNTSSNIPYASFGNNAINQSLDEFIEREELLKEAEAQAASTIQRSYRRFRTNKRKFLRDYHSTMQTCTEDQSTESLEDYPNSVIQIKLDHKRPKESDNSFEDARMENHRRPMYSLNIDEYDTATRRMTLTRGVAMQRNSTPEEDSGKSDNVSGEKKSSTSEPATNLALAEESPISSSDLSEDKKSSTSGDEKENKDNSSSKSSEAVKEPSDGMKATSTALSNSGRQYASLDVQKLFIARQRTMPVQIETSVIRAQPKHMRKRIKSAGMIRK
ncbi:uncharacterized protein LOC135697329 [Ochlerotatus camptorhynchus]|uniref:uncharacterized protein LOC135697329 n=1 Tax=Ochlerotatus camptorhynchus TaxID=644619 RepID=UPI0031D2CFA4